MAMVEIPDSEEKEEEVKIPGFETIPVLPADYPLFDWADWPQSRAALQSGVATNRFQKDAWNAIVNALDSALKTVGADPYLLYGLEDSLILTPYGKLKASAINGVRHHIDQFTPFPWPWAVDPNFRGYIGTKWFTGTTIEYDETGAISSIRQGDEVYPEYILELARRVNLLLELMRGTADIAESTAYHAVQSRMQLNGAVTGMGVATGQNHIARTQIGNITLEKFSGTGFYTKYLAASLARAYMEKTPAAGFSRWLPFFSKIALSGRAARDEQVLRTGVRWLAASMLQAEAGSVYASYTNIETLRKSLITAGAAKLPPMPTSNKLISTSLATVTADVQNDLKMTSAQHQSVIDLQIDIMSIIPRFVVAAPKAKTLQQLEILLTKMIEVLMHGDLSMLLSSRPKEEWTRDILMALNGDSLPMLGQVRKESPAALMLHMDPWLWSRANYISGLFNPRRAFLFDTGIWTANRALEQPEGSVLWALSGLLRTVRPIPEPPVEYLLQTIRTDAFDVSGRLQLPERAELDAIMLLIGMTDVRSYRGREALLNWVGWLTVCVRARLEQATAVQLLALNRSPIFANGVLEGPTAIGVFLNPINPSRICADVRDPDRLYVLAFLRLFGTTDVAIQEPTAAGLFLLPKRLSVAAGRLQNFPEIYMRSLGSLLLGYTAADIEAPAFIQLWQPQSDIFNLCGRLQNPEDVWQFWMMPLQGMASGKPQRPEDMFLFCVDRYWFRAGGRLDAPREFLMWSDPIGLQNGSGRTRIPEDLWMFSHVRLFGEGQPGRDAPRDLHGRTVVFVLGKGIPRRDTPREVLQWMADMDFSGVASARQENPEEQYLHSPDIFIKAGSPRQDAPRELLLWVAAFEIDGFGQVQAQAPNKLRLLAQFVQTAATRGVTDRPRERFLETIGEFCNFVAPAQQNPSSYFLNGIAGTVSMVWPRLQLPGDYLSAALAGTVSWTDAEIMLPWTYRGGLECKAAMVSNPKQQGPEDIRLYVDTRLAAVARTARILRRATQGIMELLDTGFLSADLMEPMSVRMLSESLLMTMANAGLLNRKAVQTSGYLAEQIGGFIAAELLGMDSFRMAATGKFSAEARSAIAYVAYTTIGGGVLQTEIDADASGYIIRIVTARGSITFALPDIYTAADTAVALRSAGRQLEVQIDVQLGGISAKYASVRMWAAVPIPEIIVGGDEEPVRSIIAVTFIEEPGLMAQNGLTATERIQGETDFELISFGGGLVMKADKVWADPVHTGSNLYIRFAWQAWNFGEKLYIDKDVLQVGSNLYIHSVDSSYQDRNQVFIDLSVWLVPIQEGDNLHIRSADYVWTDGDSTNVDTEFFLEPVQEGSNLYIRQDTFGGK